MTFEYSNFDPKVDKPLHELTRHEAEAAYEWFMSQKDYRKNVLLSYAVKLGYDLHGNDKERIETFHKLLVSEIKKEGVSPNPSSYILSLCNDIAIFISELLIKNAPHLSWGMHTAGKSDLSYQRPVIRGFNVKNKNYSVDIDYLLCQYAHRLCSSGQKEEELMWKIYSSALSKA
jgi:hypothetical protein